MLAGTKGLARTKGEVPKVLSGPNTVILLQLVSRNIRTEYLENVTGFAWLILQPLLMLAVYAFVFSTIFQARMPEASEVGFVPFLAVAFWPWTAFAESVLKSSTSIKSNAALIGKVAFASELLPLSIVAATFAMHMAGYLVVLVVLALSGTDLHWLGLIIAVPLLLLLALFAAGLALFASALQVFLRDLAQILPPLMTFWFFTTPILYSSSMLPDSLEPIFRWNPASWFVQRLRESLLTDLSPLGIMDLVMPLISVGMLVLGLWFFRRLRGHFEDFL
jgi:lipopolysaccharide transport system permease protein